MTQREETEIEQIARKVDDILLCVKGDESIGIQGLVPRTKKTEQRITRIEFILYAIALSGTGTVGVINREFLINLLLP